MKRDQRSIVYVRARTDPSAAVSEGTGFIVLLRGPGEKSSLPYVLTAAHVVKKSTPPGQIEVQNSGFHTRIRVRAPGASTAGEGVPATPCPSSEPTRYDPAEASYADWTLLALPPVETVNFKASVRWPTTRADEYPYSRRRLKCLGYPGGAKALEGGIVMPKRKRRLEVYQDENTKAGLLGVRGGDLPRAGMSGGPYLTWRGQFVAIHRQNRGAAGEKIAIDARHVRDTLERRGFEPVDQGWPHVWLILGVLVIAALVAAVYLYLASQPEDDVRYEQLVRKSVESLLGSPVESLDQAVAAMDENPWRPESKFLIARRLNEVRQTNPSAYYNQVAQFLARPKIASLRSDLWASRFPRSDQVASTIERALDPLLFLARLVPEGVGPALSKEARVRRVVALREAAKLMERVGRTSGVKTAPPWLRRLADYERALLQFYELGASSSGVSQDQKAARLRQMLATLQNFWTDPQATELHTMDVAQQITDVLGQESVERADDAVLANSGDDARGALKEFSRLIQLRANRPRSQSWLRVPNKYLLYHMLLHSAVSGESSPALDDAAMIEDCFTGFPASLPTALRNLRVGAPSATIADDFRTAAAWWKGTIYEMSREEFQAMVLTSLDRTGR